MKRAIIFILVVFCIILMIWLNYRRHGLPSADVGTFEHLTNELPKTTNTQISLAPKMPAAEVQLYKPKNANAFSDPRWQWWNRMEKEDPKFEWKMPIELYGKVVDENEHPVVGASVHCTWTDLSPTGTSKAEMQSDANGLFSLTGRQ